MLLLLLLVSVDLAGAHPFASSSFNSAFLLRDWVLAEPGRCNVSSVGKEAMVPRESSQRSLEMF